VKVKLAVLIGILTMAALPVAGNAATPTATVPTPTVEGPITTGNGRIVVQSSNFDLARVGYEQAEYFVSGTARSYTSATPLTTDGKWTVTPDRSAPYTTRIVVYRPIDPKKFNGTAMVEWLNVTGGIDSGANWTLTHAEQIREGNVWVGVTAQKLRIVGGTNTLVASQVLKIADPVRYGPLEHPGDAFSYDIYSQVGKAVRADTGGALGGLKPRRVIAVGESQSAIYLTTYVNAIARSAKVYDGYLFHGRAGAAGPLDGSGIFSPDRAPTRIRTDLHVPMLIFETESDLVNLDYAPAQQPDTRFIRTWEVAGTSHYDTYGLVIGPKDPGDGSFDTPFFDSMVTTITSPYPGIVDCNAPINAGAATYVLRAAVAALQRWVAGGTAPPRAPRLKLNGATSFALDANGNALGGIRTPHVDSPIATLSGLGQTGSGFCFLFGTTTPFTAAKLASLYPSHAAFMKEWDQATDKAVKAGFVLAADAKHIKAAAAQSTVGN
jgi:hypothetical protein